MQPQHRRLPVAGGEQWSHFEATCDRVLDQRVLLRPRRVQHIIDDFLFARSHVARMADADPQAPEIVAAELLGDVVEPVVAAGAAAAPVDFEFAEDVTIGRRGSGEEDSDVPSARGLGKFEVIRQAAGRGKRLQRAPAFGVAGNLDRACGGAADPVENHAIESAGGAEIDVDPLLAVARGLPGGSEVERSAYLDALVVAEEPEFADAPLGARAAFICHAVEAGVRGRGELHGDGGWSETESPAGAGRRCGPRSRWRSGSSTAKFFPRFSIVRARDHNGAASGCLTTAATTESESAAGGHIDTVDFEGSVAAAGLDLNPQRRTADRHAGGGVVIHRVFALLPFQRAAIAGGDGKPAWELGVGDAVGDQLGGVVEVVAARLVGRTVEREVANRLRIRNQRRGEVLPGISRIDADTARVLLRL